MNQKMIFNIRALSCMLIVTTLTGCYCLTDHHNEKMISWKNRYRAHKAWKEVKDNCDNIDVPGDFGRGFRAGYYDVALGGDGCPPAVPPRRYWSVWYQNHKGHYKQRRWFDGYEHGALVAEQNGAANYNYIATSNRVLHDQPIPDYQNYHNSTPMQTEENTLPSLAPGTDSTYLNDTGNLPLLPITAPPVKEEAINRELAPQTLLNNAEQPLLNTQEEPAYKTTLNSTEQPVQKRSRPIDLNLKNTNLKPTSQNDLSNFHPFPDDSPELNSNENLEIGPMKNYVYRGSKPQPIQIRPANTIQQVNYEQEQVEYKTNKNNQQSLHIQPQNRVQQSNYETSDNDTDWLMPRD